MSTTPPDPTPTPVRASAAEMDGSSPPPVGPLFIAIYALALFGVWMAINLPATVTIALRVGELDPEGKTTLYSLVAGVGTLAALVANPIFGQLSDHTRSRFGRRRPWIVVGLIGTSIGAVVIGTSNSAALLVVGWILMQTFVQACIAPILAIVADHVPTRQQGVVGALSGTAGAASTVAGIFFIQAFPTSILAQIGLPVATAIVFCVALIAMFSADRPADRSVGPYTWRALVGSFSLTPRRSPDFSLFLGGMFLLAVGFGVVNTYAVYFIQDRLGLPAEDVTTVVFIAFLVTGILTLVVTPLAGWVSDRLGRRKPILILAPVVSLVGVLVIISAQGPAQFIIGMGLSAGVAAGMLFGVYIALGVETIADPATVAKNLGIVNIAVTLPFSLVPFVAPLVLAVGGGSPNFVLLYIGGGIVSLCGIPFLARIRVVR